MQSMFNSRVTVDNHTIEADVSVKGTEIFKITNRQTGEKETVRRKGTYAKTKMRVEPLPDGMERALEKADIGIIR